MPIKRLVRRTAGALTLAASIALTAPASVASAARPMSAPATTDQASLSIYVAGTVQSGAEGGCLVLVTTYGTTYNLLGGTPDLVKPGAQLLVNGILQFDTATVCMQGYPLQVVSAWPL